MKKYYSVILLLLLLPFSLSFSHKRIYPIDPSPCSERRGCHNGYCWSGCSGALANVNGVEWCYTSVGGFGGEYTRCNSDQE
ncbi:7938_t:CDS:1, partial [Cetraspora pellucida]